MWRSERNIRTTRSLCCKKVGFMTSARNTLFTHTYWIRLERSFVAQYRNIGICSA
jgi:hypothetical protein